METEKKAVSSWSANNWKLNIVTDPEAPQFYSQNAIWAFSIFFTVVFGAVLLASNLNDKKAKWTVLGFGIAYTAISLIVLNLIPMNTGLTIGVNIGGAIILTQLFWGKFIGKETKFRIKPIWKPLIISLLIMVPFIAAIIYSVAE